MSHKILCGTVVRQEPVVLNAYVRSLLTLRTPLGTELHFGFVNDGGVEEAAALDALNPVIVLQADVRPADALYAVGAQTHAWNEASFDHVGRQKQRLIAYAIEHAYSHVFFVDSDLLMEPDTLLSLYSAKAPIVNAVFWTRWHPDAPPQPQCWLQHPYGFRGFGMEEHEFLGALTKRQMVRCAGGGACVLIETRALQRGVRYHPRLALPKEGMWQGEDRTFAVCAQRLHERQLADGWPDVFHAYAPHQRTPEMLDAARNVLGAPKQTHAGYGDMVSFTVEALEDAQVATGLQRAPELRCVRGRLGGIALAPELEAALCEMKVGSETMLDAAFPYYHEIVSYRNQKKVIRLTLVDCKPYSMAPVLAEEVFANV